ncbi:MAG TPA: hypothetical protein VNT26_05800, partial [Candidatus Sulfotelmatobacter sp.]|nr:hypothetical protein [Candidatus Sulfotelmatobacter sp.]
TILDPDLQLNQLETVQRDVANLLEHGLPATAVPPQESPPEPAPAEPAAAEAPVPSESAPVAAPTQSAEDAPST